MTAAAGERTLYERVGGQDFFDRVVDYFYDAVERDLILLPLYPEGAATSGARRRLALFLAQYWGGPTTYDDERGHPRLRMRHMDFAIDGAARDRWLTLMHEAMSEQVLNEEQETRLWTYLVSAAFAMQNIPDDPAGRSLPTLQ